VHGRRWLGHAIGNRYGPGLGAVGDARGQPKYRQLGQRLDTDLVRHECDVVFRLGRLVGQQSGERFAVNGFVDGERDLHVDLHGFHRKCDSVRDGFRDLAGTFRQIERRPQHDH